MPERDYPITGSYTQWESNDGVTWLGIPPEPEFVDDHEGYWELYLSF